MRYEYKIKMEADMYGTKWDTEQPLVAYGASEDLKRDLKRVFEKYAYTHLFINIDVNAIPHDSDRDYTEADAEKHLNGEPSKKRKTYADDYFEKFPNAPKMDVLTASWGIAHVPYPKFEDVYGGIKAVEVGKTKNVVFPNSKRDHFALWMAEMDDGE